MASYIPFTDEQKLRAGDVDLEEFLLRRGEKLIVSGQEKRMASDHSITVRGNEWYDHATGKGGGPVSFVRSYYGLSYPEAVTMLLGGDAKITYPSAKERKPAPPKEFALPEKYENMRRVFAYLVGTRHIDPTVVSYFEKRNLLYEDAKHHNCVFVGWDEEGIPRHAHARSSNSFGKPFRINIEGSDPRYSFHHIGTDDKLYVFEAPIDMLSFITLYPRNWREHSYVACCGTSIQPVIQTGAQMDCQKATVFLCLDNDKAGNMACERMAEEFGKAGIRTVRVAPRLKDWNDDLVTPQQSQEVKPSWPVMCGP